MLPATRQAPPTAAAAAARLARAAVTTTRRYDHQVVQRVPENAVYQTAGPGGRSSRGDRVVTVFGSTGFLSRYLCRNWAKNGNTLVVPFRASDEDKRHLKVMGDLGQVIPMRWHIEDEKSIAECVRHADVVYNLVGRDFETKNFTFNKAMVEGAQRIARICREEGVERMVHVSALNANVNSPSRFLQAKALGEEVVRAEFADATIVRPAGTYGVEDRFFNRLGWLMRVLPFGIPLPRNGNALISPVHCSDVGMALFQAGRQDRFAGKTIELVGPERYRYRDVVKFFVELCEREKFLFPLPMSTLTMMAQALDTISAVPPITADEVIRHSLDENVTPGTLRFADLGIQPATVDHCIGRYVRPYRTETGRSLEQEIKALSKVLVPV